MNHEQLQALLDEATQLAHEAGRKTLEYFQRDDLAVDQKSDATPVTLADREAEQLIRQHLRSAHPDHAILGEEFGSDGPENASIRWIIDPIDGTKSFVCGVPLYGTLIGIEVDGEATVGVIHMPALGETVRAAVGLGCWHNHQRCAVRQVEALDQAVVTSTSVLGCMQSDSRFAELAQRAKMVRGWGDCYAYVLVATGRVDLAIDPALALWDSAPLPVILHEAGGRFCDWAGRGGMEVPNGVAGHAPLVEQVLPYLSDCR